jgi:hypothetical protein
MEDAVGFLKLTDEYASFLKSDFDHVEFAVAAQNENHTF